jgi:hypothetical protein
MIDDQVETHEANRLAHIGDQPSGVATSQGFARLRFRCSVVACTTFGLWAAGGALVGVSFALRETPVIALIADSGIAFTYLVYLGSALVFAHKYRSVTEAE